MLLPEIMRNQCKPFNFLLSLIFKQYVMNFVFAKKKKAQITITEGNEDMLRKRLQIFVWHLLIEALLLIFTTDV